MIMLVLVQQSILEEKVLVPSSQHGTVAAMQGAGRLFGRLMPAGEHGIVVVGEAVH